MLYNTQPCQRIAVVTYKRYLMSYYLNKTLPATSFDAAMGQVTTALKNEGFGVLTEIDVQATLKKKIGADFKPYKILGACNPHFAHKALQNEDKIGVFLPCNVVVEEHDNGEVEVFAVDPIASMSAVNNEALGGIAQEIQQKLKRVVEALG